MAYKRLKKILKILKILENFLMKYIGNLFIFKCLMSTKIKVNFSRDYPFNVVDDLVIYLSFNVNIERAEENQPAKFSSYSSF